MFDVTVFRETEMTTANHFNDLSTVSTSWSAMEKNDKVLPKK